MRDEKISSIVGAIVHMIRRPAGVFSEVPIELDGPLSEFLQAHIQNSLKDPMAVAAKFRPPIPKSAAESCGALLAGKATLVEGSSHLASLLQAVLTRDARISEGDLVVCSYLTGPSDQLEQRLALLKLDPSEIFRHEEGTDALGRRYVRFVLVSGSLPSAREKLQKVALIRPADPVTEYDILLLDRQAPGEDRGVARFFRDDFLGADLAFDDYRRTRDTYTGLLAARGRLQVAGVSEATLMALDVTIAEAMTGPSMDVDAFVTSLPLPDEQKQIVQETVAGVSTDRVFALDPALAAKLIARRRFVGEHGLKVEVESDYFKDVIELTKEPTQDDPFYEVRLRTRTWRPVLRS